MKAKKEYDSPLPREELIAKLRKRTVPYRLFKLGRYDWELKEYEDGTFRATKSHGKYWAEVRFQLDTAEYGTHITAEYGDGRPSFALIMFFFVAMLILTADAIYELGIKGLIVLPVGVGLFLIGVLYDRAYEKEAIEWLETDVLGIKKQ